MTIDVQIVPHVQSGRVWKGIGEHDEVDPASRLGALRWALAMSSRSKRTILVRTSERKMTFKQPPHA